MDVEKGLSIYIVLIILLSCFGFSSIFIEEELYEDLKVQRLNSGNTRNNTSTNISQQRNEIVDKQLRETIDSKSEGDLVDVIIRLRLKDFDISRDINKTFESDNSVESLRDNSREVQTEIKRYLKSNDVEILNTFWVANSILARLDVDLIDDLTKIPEIWKIHENFEVEIPETTTHRDPINDSNDDEKNLTWGLERINVKEAWEGGKLWQEGFDGSGVRVAVSDTGVDIDHPDLEGKMVTADEYDESYPGGWIAFDREGNIIEDAYPLDNNGHGTHVSGTIHGGNSSGTSIGVAPGAEMMHAVVLPGGIGNFSQIMAGLEWKIEPYDRFGNTLEPIEEYRPHITSMSWGRDEYYPYYEEPIKNLINAGIIPISSIGNSGEGIVGSPGAIYETWSVGASDENDDIAGFSSGAIIKDERGDTPKEYVKPDFSSPGVGVKSSVPNNKWESYSGTSMACPHVAGAVALMLEADPSLTMDEIYEALKMTSNYFEDGENLYEERKNTRYGYGIIDVSAALDYVKNWKIIEPIDISQDSAVLKGEILRMPEDEVEVFFRYREKNTDSWEETDPIKITQPVGFDSQIDGLESNSRYEYKAVATSSDRKETTYTMTFSTHKDIEITSLNPKNITGDSAVLRGEIKNIYVDNASTFFRYRKKGKENWSETEPQFVTDPLEFKTRVDNLSYLRTYEYKAVASSDVDFTGHKIDFTTDASEPYWDAENERYIISNASELQWIRNDLDNNYILQNDINASETKDWVGGDGFDPIGDTDNKFNGTFDGRGQKISDLYIDKTSYAGLFHSTGDVAIVKNITVEDVVVKGNSAGGIVAINEGKLINVSSEGMIEGSTGVGGLIGINRGELKFGFSTAIIKGSISVGGLIGINEGDLEKTYFTGDHYSGRVEGSISVGGLVGTNSGILMDSYSIGDVRGSLRVGGLVGENIDGMVINSYAAGRVFNDQDGGGLIGDFREGEISSSFYHEEMPSCDFEGYGSLSLIDEEFNSISTFESAGWDIEMIDTDVDYPYLAWEDNNGSSVWHIQKSEVSYNLTINVEGGGTVDPEEGVHSYYEYGKIVVKASPGEEYYFDGWSGDIDSKDYIITLTMVRDKTIYADFERIYYNISNWEHLYISRFRPEQNFTLENDLNKTTKGYDEYVDVPGGWDPIGKLGDEFRGELDGKGHVIHDLKINRSDRNHIGLFGILSEDAVVFDLNIEKFEARGGEKVGAMIGLNNGTVSESMVKGNISGNDLVGGIIGMNKGTLRSSKSIINADATANVGGLVGSNNKGNIYDSHATGNIEGGHDIGGGVGNNYGKIIQSYFEGNVTGDRKVGGLVGDNSGFLNNSNVVGNIDGKYNIGGLVGINHDKVIQSYFEGNVTGDQIVSGLVGKNSGIVNYSKSSVNINGFSEVGGLIGENFGLIKNSRSSGNIIGEYNIGGLVGKNFVDIKMSSSTGNVEGTSEIGGLVGKNRGLIESSSASSNASGDSNVGALIGFNDEMIYNSTSKGTATGRFNIGGLLGKNSGEVINSSAMGFVTGDIDIGGFAGNNKGTLSYSYSSGNVTGENHVGGFTGKNSGLINNTYSIGSVQGDEIIGGLVGLNKEMIDYSYAAGNVSGNDLVGGLVGWNWDGEVTHSFWDIDSSGIDISDGGEGKTTAKLILISTFIDYGWSFERNWNMMENETYPFFQWQEEKDLPYAPDPISFLVEIINTNSPVYKEDKLEVTIKIKNIREVWITQDIELLNFNGDIVNVEEELSIPPNSAKTITLEWSTSDEEFGTDFITVRSQDDKDRKQVEILRIFELIIDNEGSGNIEINGKLKDLPYEGKHEEGTEFIIKAIPEEGWRVVKWDGNLNYTEENDKEIIVILEDDSDIKIYFEEEDSLIDYWWLFLIIISSILLLYRYFGKDSVTEIISLDKESQTKKDKTEKEMRTLEKDESEF